MAWKPPASDGGAKVRNYYLEKREKKQNKWIAVTTEEIRETVFSVQNLIEGLEYEFRVKCENLGGESEWSEISEPVTPKSDVPIQAPHFKEELRNLNVRYQSNATLVCKVTGHPKPVVKWYRQGKEIIADGLKYRIQEFKGGYHQLIIASVTDDDATVYQVRATNQGGSVSGTASLECHFPARVGCSDRWESEQAGMGLGSLQRCSASWWEETQLVRTQLWLAQVSCRTDGACSLSGLHVMDLSQDCRLLIQE